MNLEELRTFLAIVEGGSLAAAAQRLHVTPSTVTARLNTLERQLGCRVLQRKKVGAELTSAGFKLQRYAELMLQLWKQANFEVALPPGVEDVCNIGVDFDLWRDVGERFLDRVRASRPGVALALWPGEQRQLQRWLGMGLIDLAFCHDPQGMAGCASRLHFEDEIVLWSATAADDARMDAAYVYVDHGDEFRRQHAAAFPAASPPLTTLAASEWALEHMLKHGGKGYLPLRMVAPLLSARRLHRVKGAPVFKRRVYVVENVAAVERWEWYRAALAASKPGRVSRPRRRRRD